MELDLVDIANRVATGESVWLSAYGGETIQRTVCEIREDVVYVCKQDEYRRAVEERRRPMSVGFPFTAIVGL